MIKVFCLVISGLMFVSCAELQTVVNEMAANQYLTKGEISRGLKEALRVGSENAVGILSVRDGFYGDRMVKVLMPPKARNMMKNIRKIPGAGALADKVELRLNRAAEDAAQKAAPIFASAVADMSIQDAFGILHGADTSATDYLRSKTYEKLTSMFMPVVSASLDKDLVAGVSTNQSWDALTGIYNKAADTVVGRMYGMKSIMTNLDTYVTDQALKGVFLKLSEEEIAIRKNPSRRITKLLKRVFSALD